MNNSILTHALTLISENPSLLRLGDELDLPNAYFPTMGGTIWWRDLARANGWRIQQNSITHHCRILDDDDCRVAWGGESAMFRLFEKISTYA